MEEGRYYRAREYLKKARKKLSHWGLAHLEYARSLYYTGGEDRELADALEKARKLLPNNPRVFAFSGLYWESRGKLKRALKNYLRAIELGIYDPKPCLRAAQLASQLNRELQKITHCLKILEKRKLELDEVVELSAIIFEKLRDYQKAAEYWKKAISRDPNRLFLLRRALLFFQKNIGKFPKTERRRWEKYAAYLKRRVRQLTPKKKRRRLRPLLPSKR